MKEIGIMFSAPMVRAVDQDRKTQTRRLASSPLAKLKPGTNLWVREAWRTIKKFDDLKPSKIGEKYTASIHGTASAMPVLYEADQHRRNMWPEQDVEAWKPGKLRPSIHMPRFASRIGLKLEAVRIEPLHAISEQDAIAEGIEEVPPPIGRRRIWKNYSTTMAGGGIWDPRMSYRTLWASLHQADGQRWEDNPDVVVLTFSKAWVDK